MEEMICNHNLMEDILSLLQFLEENGVPVDRITRPETQALLPEDPTLCAAYKMMCLMEEIPGGFLIYQASGDERIIYANRGLLRILRCGSWEQFRALTQGSFRGLVHPEDLDEVEESIWQQIAESHCDLDYVEYRANRQDGTVCWIEDYGHFVRAESVGDFFYVFLGDATEKRERQISEREQAEQRYQGLVKQYDQERSLIHQEHLRRLEIIEGLSVNYESILYANLKENTILAYRLSARTQRQFGEKYQTRELRWFLDDYVETWVHPEDRETVARETNPDYIRQRLSRAATYYINYRVVFQGQVQYLQLRLVNVGGGDLVDQIVMGYRRMDEELQRDMQQRQVLAEALENANLAISAKNEFLSNMSHNMRTPLNAIFGFTALAKLEVREPEVLSYLEQVESSGRQLLDLIEKVLEMSWLGNKELEMNAECDLRKIVQDTCESIRPQAEEKDQEFTVDCSGVSHSQVRGDGDKLKQLVAYLVSNAVTYTGLKGRVSVTLSEGDVRPNGRRLYRLVVKDTGIGMSEEFLKRLFEPFAREKDTTLSGVNGMGLGLTIAKYIVDRMGGSIQADSKLGQGSTFTVSLPLQLRDRDPAAPVTAAPRHTSPLRILLVEDNEINREIEAEILKNAGFLVDTAENGIIAVEKVVGSHPGDYDLVLMDIQMPGMDGWQAARAIRDLEDPDLAATPIVALSANTLLGDMRRSIESGMDAHFTKPINVPRFLEEVRRAATRNEKQNS